MWTPTARAQLARDHIPCATNLTNVEWAVVAPFMSQPAKTGRPWAWPLRQVLDGVLYVLRTGCAWEHLPHDFPPSSPGDGWWNARSPMPGGAGGWPATTKGATTQPSASSSWPTP